jgi:Cysteine-rich secretory protein family
MRCVPPARAIHLLLLSCLSALTFVVAAPAPTASASGNTASDYVSRINALRHQVGVQSLAVDGQLTGLAQGWAQHMAVTGVLSHSSLTAGVTEQWGKLGENVGMGPDNATVWNAFIHSAEHYANLVDPSYNRVGVGLAFGHGLEWTCHKFMELVGGAPPPPPPPPTTTTPPPVTFPHTTTGASSGSGSSSGTGWNLTTTTSAPATTGGGVGAGAGSTTTSVGPKPQAGPPPPASSQRVAAVLAALRQLST